MGMRVVRGRGITERDTRESPQVVVINQTLAERYFPGQDPIGKRLEVAFYTPPNWREIVGIVKDVKSAGLDQDTPVQVFTAFVQNPAFVYAVPPGLTVLARTSGDPAAIQRDARRHPGRGPLQPVYAIQPMTEVVSKSIAQRRLSLILLAFFAISALVLAAVGRLRRDVLCGDAATARSASAWRWARGSGRCCSAWKDRGRCW